MNNNDNDDDNDNNDNNNNQSMSPWGNSEYTFRKNNKCDWHLCGKEYHILEKRVVR